MERHGSRPPPRWAPNVMVRPCCSPVPETGPNHKHGPRGAKGSGGERRVWREPMELRNPDARRTRPPAPAIMTSAGAGPGCWHGRRELLAFWPAQDGCVLTGQSPLGPRAKVRERRAEAGGFDPRRDVGRAATADKRTQRGERDRRYPSCDRQGRESMPACVCLCVCGRHR